MNISIPQHFSADTYSPYQSVVLFKTEIDVDQKCIDSLFCVLRWNKNKIKTLISLLFISVSLFLDNKHLFHMRVL